LLFVAALVGASSLPAHAPSRVLAATPETAPTWRLRRVVCLPAFCLCVSHRLFRLRWLDQRPPTAAAAAMVTTSVRQTAACSSRGRHEGSEPRPQRATAAAHDERVRPAHASATPAAMHGTPAGCRGYGCSSDKCAPSGGALLSGTASCESISALRSGQVPMLPASALLEKHCGDSKLQRI
jgi:hypothetical protein